MRISFHHRRGGSRKPPESKYDMIFGMKAKILVKESPVFLGEGVVTHLCIIIEIIWLANGTLQYCPHFSFGRVDAVRSRQWNHSADRTWFVTK